MSRPISRTPQQVHTNTDTDTNMNSSSDPNQDPSLQAAQEKARKNELYAKDDNAFYKQSVSKLRDDVKSNYQKWKQEFSVEIPWFNDDSPLIQFAGHVSIFRFAYLFFILFTILYGYIILGHPSKWQFIQNHRTTIDYIYMFIIIILSAGYILQTTYSKTSSHNISEFKYFRATIWYYVIYGSLILISSYISLFLLYWLNSFTSIQFGIELFIYVIIYSIGIMFTLRMLSATSFWREYSISLPGIKHKDIFSNIIGLLKTFPSIIVSFITQFVQSSNDSENRIWFKLLGIQVVFILLYLYLPYLRKLFLTHEGLLLLNNPIYISNPTVLGNYKSFYEKYKMKYDIGKNKRPTNIKMDMIDPSKDGIIKKVRPSDYDEESERTPPNYQYGISAWVFLAESSEASTDGRDRTLDSTDINYQLDGKSKEQLLQSSGHGNILDGQLTILSYGLKPHITYQPSTNTLRILTVKGMNDIQTVYETNEFPLQKWNHIVINYTNGVIDVFINNKIVATKESILPYESFDTLKVGQENGLHGGICNVMYMPYPMTKQSIHSMYQTYKDKTPPI